MAHDKHSWALWQLVIRNKFLGILNGSIDGFKMVGAEVGVWKGHTSAMLLRELPTLTLYCVDPWEIGGDHVSMPTTTPEMFAKSKNEFLLSTDEFADRRVILPMTSIEASKRVPDGSLDFVFIDGDHTYESAKRDIELWYPKVRPGGLVSGHDYFWIENYRLVVMQAVDESAKNLGYSVQQAGGQVWYFIKRA